MPNSPTKLHAACIVFIVLGIVAGAWADSWGFLIGAGAVTFALIFYESTQPPWPPVQ